MSEAPRNRGYLVTTCSEAGGERYQPDLNSRASGDSSAPSVVSVSSEILLVEDNPDLLEGMAEQIQSLGYKVTTSCSVLAAIAELQENQSISFILSDLNLGSGGNGLELAKWTDAHIPSMRGAIMSGYFDFDEKVIRDLGWDAILKPATRDALSSLLSRNFCARL